MLLKIVLLLNRHVLFTFYHNLILFLVLFFIYLLITISKEKGKKENRNKEISIKIKELTKKIAESGFDPPSSRLWA